MLATTQMVTTAKATDPAASDPVLRRRLELAREAARPLRLAAPMASPADALRDLYRGWTGL